MSSLAEYPLTSAPWTGSESTNMRIQEFLIRGPKVTRATITANISTMAICDFRGSHFLMSESCTLQPNCKGVMFREGITPPIHGNSGPSDRSSGKLPSVKITKSALFFFISSIGRGGPFTSKCSHSPSESRMAAFSSELGHFEYCRSDRARKKALPILPHSWDEPNMSLPLSLPAWPGESTPDWSICFWFHPSAPLFCFLWWALSCA